MSIVNVDTVEINGVDGGTTVTRFDGQIDRWINTRIGGDTMGNDFRTALEG